MLNINMAYRARGRAWLEVTVQPPLRTFGCRNSVTYSDSVVICNAGRYEFMADCDMAACGSSFHINRIYQAIERYDLKHFLREAVDNRVISEGEKIEVEQWRPSDKRRMREHLIKLILAGGKERLGHFIDFIYYYANLALGAAQLLKQTGGGDGDSYVIDSYSPGASHTHGQHLDQDSLKSESTSPMEFETMVSNACSY